MTGTGGITGHDVIDIAILGELRLTISGEPTLIPPKTAQLLCELLAAGGHAVLAGTLQRRLYSREPDHRTGQALRRCVSDLRDILRGTVPPHDDRGRVIFTRRIGAEAGYGIHLNTISLDATIFQHHAATASSLMRDTHWTQAVIRLKTARGLWRGIPFTGIGDSAFAGTWKTRLLTAHQTTNGEPVHRPAISQRQQSGRGLDRRPGTSRQRAVLRRVPFLCHQPSLRHGHRLRVLVRTRRRRKRPVRGHTRTGQAVHVTTGHRKGLRIEPPQPPDGLF
jgi:hypothetical protein